MPIDNHHTAEEQKDVKRYHETSERLLDYLESAVNKKTYPSFSPIDDQGGCKNQ